MWCQEQCGKKSVVIRKGQNCGPLSILFKRFLNNFSTSLLCSGHVMRSELHTKTQKTSMMKNNVCSCALHSMHIIICGDAMSYPLSIITVWSNNYHMIWIDVTNLHSLIACYIQAILVRQTQSSHPPDLLCLADDACCMLLSASICFQTKNNWNAPKFKYESSQYHAKFTAPN